MMVTDRSPELAELDPAAWTEDEIQFWAGDAEDAHRNAQLDAQRERDQARERGDYPPAEPGNVAMLDRAAQSLEQTGITVLARGWTCADGILDLVGAAPCLGARTPLYAYRVVPAGTPAMTGPEVRRCRRLALRWMAAHGRIMYSRVEVCTVRLGALSVGIAQECAS